MLGFRLNKLGAASGSAFSLRKLFRGGYTGFISEPQTEFQTATGTTASNAQSDPVGRLVNNFGGEVWTAFYTADFSAGVDGWVAGNGSAAGNIDGIQSLDNWLRLTVSGGSGVFLSAGTGRVWLNVNRRVTLQVYVPSGQAVVDGFRVYSGNTANTLIYDGAGVNGTVVSIDATYLSTIDDLRVYAFDGTSSTITGGSGDLLYVRAVVTYSSNLPQFFNATTAERPALALIPFGGRRSITANSALAGAVAGTPGTAPTSFTLVDSANHARTIVGSGTVTLPDGTTGPYVDVDYVVAPGASAVTLITPSAPAGVESTAYTAAYHLQVLSGSMPQVRFIWQDNVTTTNRSYFSVTGTLTKYTNTYTTSVGATLARANIGIDASAGGATFRLRIAAPQTEKGSSSTAFQSVTSNFLITESGKPQVQSLYFDGVDNLSSGLAEWPGNLDFFCEAGKAFTINVCGNLLVRATAALFARYAAASGSRTLGITINSSTGFIGTELRGTTASALSGDWTDGTIRQFTLRWDGTTATVWADADASQTVGVGTAAEETSVSITFGSRFSGVSPVTGYLFPPVAINRALTDAEVAQLHALNRARYGSR